jgi:hypothetical protein
VSKTKNEKKTFMLHHPTTKANLGKYVAADHRNAALKAATRGHTSILMRQTYSRVVYEYQGGVNVLDETKEVKRGGGVEIKSEEDAKRLGAKWDPEKQRWFVPIVYRKKPWVTLTGKHIYRDEEQHT